MSFPETIAIDGPAASGKTTLALALARELGYLYFDTGVLYRAVTLAVLKNHADFADEHAVVSLAEKSVIDVSPPTVNDGRSCSVYLNGEDVTTQIRAGEIDARVSIPSAYGGVRAAMAAHQRRIGARGKVVMVGRDIGTVILPKADLKIYLDASVETRAKRRWKEFQAAGRPESYENVLSATRMRDEIDSQRAVAPLRAAPDAHTIDTTNLDVDEMIRLVANLIEQKSSPEKSETAFPSRRA